VFVNLDPAAAPLAEMLAPLANAPALPALPLVERRSHALACNWKTYVENYLEGYHLPMVHPEFDADVVVADYRVEIEGDVVFHTAPARDASVYAGTWAWLWPNLAINTYRHGFMVERMTATGPEETRLDYFYFFDPSQTAELTAMFEVSDRVTAQDKQVCEEVQRNLRAGVYQGGVLSPKHEQGVAWFQARLAKAHGEPAPPRLAAVS
jgi:choline monooxygenase